ncbi:MAG TPA: thiamine pyrophosphate-dependent enzyme [Candidatus Methylomirabilis sp.]|nr:thiamine pyrophosphate-dependent enzyme [Candidatus Methylomirabilis sp.]
MSPPSSQTLNRRAATVRILRDRGDALVVAGLGNPAFDVAAAGDTPLNFYLWGAMGGAAMMGLGLALAQPQRRVLVFTGDGEMMMGLGSLATISVEKPQNLAIIVLDNEHYAETGMQPGHSRRGVDLAGVALAAGFADAVTIRTDQELEAVAPRLLAGRGPLFTVIKVSTDPAPTALPPRDGPFLRSRFREAVLGAEAHE